MLQLKTKVININYRKITHFCKNVAPCMNIEETKKQGILVDFLQEHGTEASNMLFTQFNMDDALRVRGEEKFEDGKAEGKAEGRAEGKAESVLELLEVLGPIPNSCKENILAEQDTSTLTLWLKLAAKANSVNEFLEKI